jgi:UDP-N-acetylmuramoylalanine--D-glutamate ligase
MAALIDDDSRPVSKGVAHDATTVVVGLGATGLSCVRHLANRGCHVTVVDSRLDPPALAKLRSEYPDTPVRLGEFSPELLAGAREIVVSPGVSVAEPAIDQAKRAGVPVCGDIELFARLVHAPVVAVTGSNGKSTVTSLLAEMARLAGRAVQVGGNLGPPALSLLTAPDTDLFLLELSSFQLETTDSLAPSAATVLNISADHMDRYPGLDSYIEAKSRVFRGDGVMVLNRDDPRVAALHKPGRTTVGFTLGVPSGNDFGVKTVGHVAWLAHGAEPLLPCKDVLLVGSHNLANVLAALALGDSIGLDTAPMLAAVRAFGGLRHRCEVVARHSGVTWINDSKGTNVGATAAAICGVVGTGQLILIAGGDGKGADFTALKEVLPGRVRAVVLVGRDAPLIEAAVEGVVPVVRATSMEAAVAQADALACKGDGVLLSPACASFDMYDSYEARGEDFCACVRSRLAR